MIKSLSLILPAKNEEKNIKATIATCNNVLKNKKINYEIIVVVNASTDSTKKIVKELQNKFSKIKLIEEKKQVNKGGAVEIGFNNAKYDCVGFMDSDNSFTEESIQKIINEFEKNTSKNNDIAAVIAKKSYLSIKRKILSKELSTITLLLFGLRNTQTGLKLFKREELLKTLPLKEKGWIFDLEILWKLKKAGKKIKYVKVTLKDNSEGGFSNADIIKMLVGLLKIRFKQ